MKPASTELADLLGGDNKFFLADLVTVTLHESQGGTIYWWTGATMDLAFGGTTWSSLGPAIDSGRHRQEGQLTIDTRDVTLTCGDAVKIGGVPLQALAARSLFRRARIKIGRAYMATPGTVVGILPEFEGRVSDVQPSSTAILLRCASDLEALKLSSPRFLWTPPCQNILGDALCQVNLATYTASGAVTASPTPTISAFNTNLVPPLAPDWDLGGNWGFDRGYYGLGVVTFTSGALAGQLRACESSAVRTGLGAVTSPGLLKFTNPWPSAPAEGDAFTVELGCDKTTFQCLNKFGNNLINYRGFNTMPRTLGR